jgi:hypothetical protein
MCNLTFSAAQLTNDSRYASLLDRCHISFDGIDELIIQCGESDWLNLIGHCELLRPEWLEAKFVTFLSGGHRLVLEQSVWLQPAGQTLA